MYDFRPKHGLVVPFRERRDPVMVTLRVVTALLLVLITMPWGCKGRQESPEDQRGPGIQSKEPSVSEDEEMVADATSRIEEISFRLLPERASKGTKLTVYPSIGGPVTYQWYVNGSPYRSTKVPFLETAELSKGDVVKAVIISGDRKVETTEALIENSPPSVKTLTLAITEMTGTETTVEAEVEGEDPDGDPVIFQYEWMINGKKIDNPFPTLTASLKGGDRVTLKVVPSDGEETGPSITRTITIINSPPIVEPDINLSLQEDTIKGHITAEDPDGDPIRFILKKAPEGMSVDDSGNISWNVKDIAPGIYPVEVEVDDGRGGKTHLKFEIELKEEEQKVIIK